MQAATLCATPTWLPSPPPTIPHLILPDIASTLGHNDRLLRLRRNETSGPFGSPQVGRCGADCFRRSLDRQGRLLFACGLKTVYRIQG